MEPHGRLPRKRPGEGPELAECELRVLLVERSDGGRDERLDVVRRELGSSLERLRGRDGPPDPLEADAVEEPLPGAAALGAPTQRAELLGLPEGASPPQAPRTTARMQAARAEDSRTGGFPRGSRTGSPALRRPRRARQSADRPYRPRTEQGRGGTARQRSGDRASRAVRAGRGSLPARTRTQAPPSLRASRGARRALAAASISPLA